MFDNKFLHLPSFPATEGMISQSLKIEMRVTSVHNKGQEKPRGAEAGRGIGGGEIEWCKPLNIVECTSQRKAKIILYYFRWAGHWRMPTL